jgi:hypothetical protein
MLGPSKGPEGRALGALTVACYSLGREGLADASAWNPGGLLLAPAWHEQADLCSPARGGGPDLQGGSGAALARLEISV